MSHWPQYTILGYWASLILVNGIWQGEAYKGKFNPWAQMLLTAIFAWAYYCGGFFAPIGFAP